MTWPDISLLIKKIGVGIAIALIPLIILVGGLRLVRQFLSVPHTTESNGAGR